MLRCWFSTIWHKNYKACVFVLIIIVSVPVYLYYDHKAVAIQESLRAELRSIVPPPYAVAIEERSMHKAGATYIEIVYSSTMEFASIKDHYEAQLTLHGWQSFGVLRLKPDIEEFQFCKGSNAFKLSHHIDSPSSAGFWIDIDWGLNNCADS
jgi:hypothetical protein